MKGILCTGLIIMSLISIAYGYTGFGICNFGKEQVDQVICYGPTVLKDTIILQEVKVAGPLKADNVTMGSMMVTGTVNIAHSTIKGAAELTGTLNAEQVNFKQGLSVVSEQVVLNHSVIIGPFKINSQHQTPYVDLNCGTKVAGPIIFDGIMGVVRKTEDSMVEGKIKNGKMENSNKKCD